MDSDLEVSSQAYCKVVMHAIKYSHSTCSGFLLASKDSEDTIRIIDAIPVSHASHCLAPNYEIAFNCVSKYAQEQDLIIAGLYQADKFNEENFMDVFSQKITEKISETFPRAVLCLINFDEETSQANFIMHQSIDGKLRRKGSQTLKLDDSFELLNKIIYSKKELYRDISDFDDHFDNINCDWTNSKLSQRIDESLARA